jgi:DNA-binding GntR family transcriptional regulator
MNGFAMEEKQQRKTEFANYSDSTTTPPAAEGAADDRSDRYELVLGYPKERIAAQNGLGSDGRRRNLKAGVANVITAQILSGEMRAGQRIDQDALAAELGVSRLPIREALIMLESVGFVHSISRRGSYVSSITPDDVLDHYEIFGMASGLAARHAATTLSDAELVRLEALFVAMHRKPGPDHLADMNYQFHRLINIKSSNRLKAHLRSLGRAMPMRLLLLSDVFAPEAEAHHRAIIDALMARDGDAAAEAAAIHLRASGQYAVGALREAGFWDGT